MIRPLILAAAMLSATPALANHFRAEPAAAPTKARFVARDNVWTCGAAGCVSSRSPTRPAIVCSTQVREVGALRSFTVEGRAFGAEELAACNARARNQGAGTSLSAQ
jgi:hypothetical protein